MADETEKTAEDVLKLRFNYEPARLRKVKAKGKIAAQRLEKGKAAQYEGILSFLAPFMVDEDGEYLEYDAACDILGELDDDQLDQAAGEFLAAMNEGQLPKANGKR